MTQPLVTLVTPAHNQGEYLRETMLSVLAQDYPHLEYIVIDDGSSDETWAVAQAVAAEHPGRVQVLTQANAGQSATLNRGWAMAQGELLGYLSSDDRLEPGAVRGLVAALQAAPACAVAYGDFRIVDAQGHFIRMARAPAFDQRALLEDLVCAPGVGALFRREVFARTGGWDVQRRQVPDFEFWLRASEVGDFVHHPACVGDYRIHEGSASFKVMPPERADEILRVVQQHWARRPDTPPAVARRSVARAFTLAGKNHAQSGRVGQALQRYAAALRLRPALLFEPGLWRQIVVGFVRRWHFNRQMAKESSS
ncbi:glycosyltransferase [Roseateles paludis]|uniref:Glycosyltransferase n=1 Tax=Roseateles paludis TaxID=3145238 RepID=A0ABV0G6E8_9BURK